MVSADRYDSQTDDDLEKAEQKATEISTGRPSGITPTPVRSDNERRLCQCFSGLSSKLSSRSSWPSSPTLPSENNSCESDLFGTPGAGRISWASAIFRKNIRLTTRPLHKTLCFWSSKMPLVLKRINRKCLIVEHLLHLQVGLSLAT